MDTLEILKAGRELISDPARWTQHYSARNSDRELCDAESGDAECWCSLGATWRIGGYDTEASNAAYEALHTAADMSVASFNDTHTHTEVLAMWDRAIAAEEAKSLPNYSAGAR